MKSSISIFVLFALATGCGDDNEANRRGVGATCETNDDCTEAGQECLLDFKGGYCGVKNCTTNDDCPEGSGCVTEGGANYCFLVCDQKSECNVNRTADVESNCSSTITWADEELGKACVPPSGQ
jgi:hypothetical protein